MLVLSRKVGERVVIGDQIVVTVLEVKGRQVRLGFEAPPEIQIWRGEWLIAGGVAFLCGLLLNSRKTTHL